MHGSQAALVKHRTSTPTRQLSGEYFDAVGSSVAARTAGLPPAPGDRPSPRLFLPRGLQVPADVPAIDGQCRPLCSVGVDGTLHLLLLFSSHTVPQ